LNCQQYWPGERLVGSGEIMLLFRVLAGALLLLLPAAARAQTVWDMATEYPQSAMPGLGVTTFAKHVAETSAGKLQIRPSFDASGGIRSAGMLAAIADGRVQAGDAFAGALEAEDAIFALPSLPFLVTSIADARRLADLARPFLAAALQTKGQRLLYLTPWPPSGIWSKSPLKTPSDLAGLSIRTYDKVSSEVFASAGANAASISFADTMPKLAEGSINAVLSSGDGGSGRKLWEFLPYFSEITYSLPLSVASVNQAIYDGLTPDLRDAVDTASRQTEIELWLALSTRLQENYQRMRQNGVTIDSSPAPAVVAALQSGAAAAQQAWCTRSGPTCPQVYEAFKAGKP
jgi:TRAP-type C4-dicarboxylate transport system substrate-binding protein